MVWKTSTRREGCQPEAMEIDDELATFMQPGPFSVIVATCDAQRVPETIRAWGQRVLDDRQTIELFVGRQPARRLMENLRSNDSMAVAIANVTTYQALQLKGRCIAVGEAKPEDHARIRAHGAAFVAGAALVGIPEQAARGILVSDVIRLRFVPEVLFDQTPGPEAGVQR